MARKKESKISNTVLLRQEKAIAEIRLNRPETLNAFNVELATELGEALEKVAKDKTVRAVILRGEGRAFSAGGDLKMFHEALPRADRAFHKISTLLHAGVKLIRTMPKPVIAGVHGPAFAAGFGLVLACDLVMASKSAKLSASFINLALTPNGSSTIFLPRLAGFKRATECFFTGKVLSADQALDWGLVNRVVDDEAFESELWNYANDLAARPTRSLAKIKTLMNQSLGLNWINQLALEKNAIAWSATTPDFAEGVTAFVEKRSPLFQGK